MLRCSVSASMLKSSESVGILRAPGVLVYSVEALGEQVYSEALGVFVCSECLEMLVCLKSMEVLLCSQALEC